MEGITVNIREVANMPDFLSYILPSTSWRSRARNLSELMKEMRRLCISASPRH